MNSKYQLKEENLRKTLTIKHRTTSTHYSLCNLTPSMAEFLYHNGYADLFIQEEEEVTEEIINPIEDVASEEVSIKPKRKQKRK